MKHCQLDRSALEEIFETKVHWVSHCCKAELIEGRDPGGNNSLLFYRCCKCLKDCRLHPLCDLCDEWTDTPAVALCKGKRGFAALCSPCAELVRQKLKEADPPTDLEMFTLA